MKENSDGPAQKKDGAKLRTTGLKENSDGLKLICDGAKLMISGLNANIAGNAHSTFVMSHITNTAMLMYAEMTARGATAAVEPMKVYPAE